MEKEYNELHDELRPEYDETVLKNGIRGKYVKRYQEKNQFRRNVCARFGSDEHLLRTNSGVIHVKLFIIRDEMLRSLEHVDLAKPGKTTLNTLCYL
ncbi:hypothetical protein CSA56_01495 [candidate division KSB3 bacterium]|uniref:Uncharacterized protein n=1 Tax=candidate division KSB3 bacterium TaxID=2044937 RepID=A0A2G6KKB0_9BACT|nr:MAG: hypothetical protein CSA56_01495 [candidate division KSB3 bacterium]